MSLKAIHILFIIASGLLSIFFGVWGFREYFGRAGQPVHLVYGILSVLMLGGLAVYGRYFLRKLKHIAYL